MITTADYGLSSPSGTSIGPPAMTYQSRILTQWDNCISSKVMQVFHRPADAGDIPVDRFNRPVMVVVAAGDKVKISDVRMTQPVPEGGRQGMAPSRCRQ